MTVVELFRQSPRTENEKPAIPRSVAAPKHDRSRTHRQNAYADRSPLPFIHSRSHRRARQGTGSPPKKSKNLHKHSCGFAAIRIDHGHQRGRPIRLCLRWAISSVGRAPRLHRGCREFESLIAHHSFPLNDNYLGGIAATSSPYPELRMHG